MKHLNNKTALDINYQEHLAILEACRTLEDGFKRKIFQVTINPHAENMQDIFGIQLSFDQWDIKR